MKTSTLVTINPPNSAIFGQNVTYTATVIPIEGMGTPTGSIKFIANAKTIDIVDLINGTATLIKNDVSVDDYFIGAIYSGDATPFARSGTYVPYTITKAPTRIAITSSANPSEPGQNIFFVAAVSVSLDNNTTTPTGFLSVVFFDFFEEANILLGYATLNNGFAILETKLPTGNSNVHLITAQYIGDVNFEASDTTSILRQIVNQ